MLRPKTVSPARPDSPQKHLDAINDYLCHLKTYIENKHPEFKNKFAQLLAAARRKNYSARHISITDTLIGMLEVMCEYFHATEKHQELLRALDAFLRELNRHCLNASYSSSARDAFTQYFHKLLRKHDNLPPGFLAWYVSYLLHWQGRNLFGSDFCFNRWKVTTDVAHAERYHFSLLKSASIHQLEDYLGSSCLAFDRMNNAMWLLYEIKNLSDGGDINCKKCA